MERKLGSNWWQLCARLVIGGGVLGISGVLWGQSLSVVDVRLNENQEVILNVLVDSATDAVHLGVEGTAELGEASAEWSSLEVLEAQALENLHWQIRVNSLPGERGFYRIVHTPQSGGSQILISEVCLSNQTLIADEEGNYPDWVELVNVSTEVVNLEGWGLSDNLDSPLEWKFPAVNLAPGAYLVVFASGLNRRQPEEILHSNFRLSADGEEVVLSYPNGTVADAVRTGGLEPDMTLGRTGGNGAVWNIFSGTEATPGMQNGISGRVFVEAPVFSSPPGMYFQPIQIGLDLLSEAGEIWYSTDGGDPVLNGHLYGSSLDLAKTTAIRMVTVNGNGDRSDEVVGTFFVEENHSLAVISIVAPGEDFRIRDGFLYGFGEDMFNPRGQVTANFPYSASNAWKDREIEVSMELFEPGGFRGFQQRLGVKVFGGWGSRGYPQKSLAFFARKEYGVGRLRYPLFPDLPLDSFESFVLRNSGNDNQSTHQIPPRPPITQFGPTQSNGSYFVNSQYTLFRDAMLQKVAERLDVDRQGYRPVAVYLNGDYWGIYNIREKLSEHYVESHHGVLADSVDLIEGYGTANAGSFSFYNTMRNYFTGNSLTGNRNYEVVVNNYLQESSFMDYHLAVIYFQNFDIGNIKQWRDRNGGKFRWMLYDQDYGFDLWPPEVYLPAMKRDYADYDNMFSFYTNTSGSGTGWPNASGRTLFLRKMLENEGFRTRFINRCADLLNQDFVGERVVGIIDEMAAVIRPEMPRHLARWSWESLVARDHGSPFKAEDVSLDLARWEENVQAMKDYALERPAKLRSDLMAHFRLAGGTFGLSVNVMGGAGQVQVNTIKPEAYPWQGVYFKDVPVQLTAIPPDGMQVEGWLVDGVERNENPLELAPGESDLLEVIAVFGVVP